VKKSTFFYGFQGTICAATKKVDSGVKNLG